MKHETRFLRVILLWAAVMLFAIPLNSALAADDGRIRVGITVYANSQMGLNDQDALLITNILTDNLVGTPNVLIYERQRFDAILEELRRTGSVIFDTATAAQLGEMAGVQYVITASLSELQLSSTNNFFIRGMVDARARYEVNVRMINVETGEVRLSKSAEGSESKTFQGNNRTEMQSLRTAAIRKATRELAEAIKDEIRRLTMFAAPQTAPPAISSAADPVQPQPQATFVPPAPGHTEFENTSTDPNVVIPKYPLSSGEINIRRITHLNVKTLRGQEAYDKYVELFEYYNEDYLAAYEAGEAARRLIRFDEARTWYERALSINPNYEPARRARDQM